MVKMTDGMSVSASCAIIRRYHSDIGTSESLQECPDLQCASCKFSIVQRSHEGNWYEWKFTRQNHVYLSNFQSISWRNWCEQKFTNVQDRLVTFPLYKYLIQCR